jgi:GNAT superfamily N-acetyltransferase
MLIRKLDTYSEYGKAIELRVRCWDEELAGYAPNRLDADKELDFLIEWEQSAEENDDVRSIYGVFESGEFAGFAGASYAESSDSDNGFELNYLFVHEDYRGKAYSFHLMKKLLEEFIADGKTEMIVYSHRHAPSNNLYRKLGGKVIREVVQGGEDHLQIDVFSFDAKKLNTRIQKALSAKKT